MDGGNEQRVAIKFCFKIGISTTETLEIWCKRFMELRLSIYQTFLDRILDFEMEGSW
jgi:hypothetical protein